MAHVAIRQDIADNFQITGNVIQNDDSTPAATQPKFLHMGSYSGSTNASGHIVFSHGCNFTPTGALIVGSSPGGTFANLTCGVNSFTSSQCDVNWTVANTGAAFASSTITFYALFWA